MIDLKFEAIYQKVKDEWPESFFFEDLTTTTILEENISNNLIGIEGELIFRGLSYALMLYINKNFIKNDQVEINLLDKSLIKEIFEERISTWKVEDDGFSSDIKSRDYYFICNN